MYIILNTLTQNMFFFLIQHFYLLFVFTTKSNKLCICYRLAVADLDIFIVS